ncbi:response regulator [Dyadobacter arcticus]|uniref:DNA-binding NarL/FixJ family response regulator n=1 Tax=Dyadobacter arcticus TaxID=1078754 RepID=A0ABX0UPC2_9BACT|nr:response regulator transcription factor [Dyadobacter arcticus]NIJ54843.1 DNA-binding NarL/FixJ family response regulator [Dyadobacter arcticus]
MDVILVDESMLLISALKNLMLLVPEVSEVEIYTDGREFLDIRSNNPPDILVMDLTMPGPNGLDLLETCKATLSADMKIVVFSSATDAQSIKQAIRRGANGILSRLIVFEEFKEAIQQVANGKQYISSDLRQNLINSVFSDDQVVLHLSPREKEVLQKVCSGRTIKEIAFDLKLSAHTVQYYHRSVMEKLKVKRTTDLIVYAIQHRLYIPEVK